MPSDVRLSRLLRRPELAAILDAAVGDDLCVLDPQGMRVAGPRPADPAAGVPVARPDGSALASVAGPNAHRAAVVLAGLARLEQERRDLAAEVLDLYREVNVLYGIGETLATAGDRTDLAEHILRETTRLVHADSAAVVVRTGSGDPAVTAAQPGQSETAAPPADLTRLRIDTERGHHVLVAPLTFRDVHRGAVFLRRDAVFSAADLKLVGAVAAAAASVLERIIEEEVRADAAAAREQQLRAQVEQLRIELDHQSQRRQVERITESDYFGSLRAQAADLRRIIAERPE